MIEDIDVLRGTVYSDGNIHGKVSVMSLLRMGNKELFFVAVNERLYLVNYDIEKKIAERIRSSNITYLYDVIDGIVKTDCNREQNENFTVGVKYDNVVYAVDRDYRGKTAVKSKLWIVRTLSEQLLHSISELGVTQNENGEYRVGMKWLLEEYDKRLARIYSTVLLLMEERISNFIMDIFEDCLFENSLDDER